MKTGILLINLGTPNSPTTLQVRKYLTQFLNDPRVIDIPLLARTLLVNLIIVPFRAPKSAESYKLLWDDKGSPLLYYGQALKDILFKNLEEKVPIALGMRYGKPTIGEALNELKQKGVQQIIALPLFPQYASASTGSATEKLMKEISKWQVIPNLKIINSFYDQPAYYKSFAAIGKSFLTQQYDHILFSYHGLPERQIIKGHTDGRALCEDCLACKNPDAQYCYRNACYKTTVLIAAELGLQPEQYTNCFQSRLGKEPWLLPNTEFVIEDLAKKGKKKVLVFCPSFVADCLETTVEIGIEYTQLFQQHGGQELQLVPSLNVNETWVKLFSEWMQKEVNNF